MIETTEAEGKKKKDKNSEDRIKDIWENVKHCNI